MRIFSYPSVLTFVLGAHKNRLIETVLLSTHKICFEIYSFMHFYLDAYIGVYRFLSKIQGLLKTILQFSKFMKKSDLSVKILLQKW